MAFVMVDFCIKLIGALTPMGQLISMITSTMMMTGGFTLRGHMMEKVTLVKFT